LYIFFHIIIYIIGWKEQKPWSEFFAVLKLPQWNAKHMEQRVTTNLLHYRSNYIIICAIIFVLQIIFAPFVFFSIIFVTAFCIYMLVITHNVPIVIGETSIDNKGKKYITMLASIVFLGLSGAIEKLLWSTLYCILIISIHALFRPRSVTSKTNKLYEELKLNGFSWFGGKDSADNLNDSIDMSDLENPEGSDKEHILGNGPIRKRNSVSSH
jgi:hypothetical protein